MGKYVDIKSPKINLPEPPKDFIKRIPIPIPSVPIGAWFTSQGFPANIELNLQPKVKRAIESGLQNVKLEATRLLPIAMQSGSWGFSGGNRDIVDTGELMRSMQVTISGTSIEITYGEPYAALMHYGGYIQPYGNKSAKPVYLPGRPWVDAVMGGGGPVEAIDYYSIYQKALNQAFSTR
jgi:hypothetical protein